MELANLLRPGPARHGRTAALVLASALLAAGCAVEAPKAPSTDFVLSIPVANDSTRIADLVGDRNDYLKIDPQTGGMGLHVTVPLPGSEDEVIGRAEVGENLKATSQSVSFSTELGVIRLPGQGGLPPIDVRLSQLLGQTVPTGIPVPVSATSFDVPPQSFQIPSVTELEVSSGGMSVSVANDLPLGLANVRMVLTDTAPDPDEVVADLDLGDLAANGGSASGVFDLAGTMSGQLAIGVTGTTVEGTVTVQGDPALRIEIAVLPLELTRAMAVIPEQEISSDQEIELDDRVLVTEADIQQGSLTLRVDNQIPVIMSVTLTLPDLKDATGKAQSLFIDRLSSGQPQTRTFLLDNSTFVPRDPRYLRLSYTARTDSSEGEVEIAADQGITVQAETGSLVFSKVKGRMNGVRLPIPAVEREVDFPKGLDNVEIASADMGIYITSAVGFLADVDLVIDGTNTHGQTGQLEVTRRFERGDPARPRQTRLSVSSDSLTDFINLLPSQIVITPTVRVGDGIAADSIESSHWVSIDSVVFDTAPRLMVVDTTRIEPDVREISYRDSEARRRIGNNFRQARIITDLENSIPLGVGVRLFVAHRREDVYTRPSFTVPQPGREP
ncbi:MAG: hypothetical protein ABIL09_22325, partial [Gemmatimonadota bacterium]